MGVCLVENLGRSTVKDKGLQCLVIVATLLAACEELTVGEGTRTARAKGVVGVGVDVEVAVDKGNILLAGEHLLASLQQNRLQPKLNKAQRGEQTRRARTHHHDLGRVAHIGVVEMDWSRLLVGVDE